MEQMRDEAIGVDCLLSYLQASLRTASAASNHRYHKDYD
jgi:hypothetical protein